MTIFTIFSMYSSNILPNLIIKQTFIHSFACIVILIEYTLIFYVIAMICLITSRENTLLVSADIF